VLSSTEIFCDGVLFNLCESFIHLGQKKIQSWLFSFVLYVFLGKLFVKVFQSASHSFGMEKQCFSTLFLLLKFLLRFAIHLG
jgi:hypothetical protein